VKAELPMGSVKLVLGVGVIIAFIYGAWMIIPPYFANYQFEDQIKNEALHSTYTTKSEDDIRSSVLKQAKELDIPLTREQVKVQRMGTMGTGTILIDVDYTVHVALPGYPLDVHFHPSTSNRGVY
jgi:hypothetical protein